ncbi:dTDP-glucose 4,6-dehydratase [Treponema brennaborense]|uniref:dTDP-glucose 4,6-dehydratase n=1 Tax=Treponema brennaborense (strain DSM 12168 / CIP 105900 / DD5/3) TaxID=906968 RepID=F4LN32_TREBD|nr:dTDP-glucose 4,6-dehydratase [Treponema brennaborense]AEE15818.1 dTDP-glucose 4,6-dehydratase [Treponema brennaborense DSM 12168]
MAKRSLSRILVTGGAGFIGCNFIHYLFGLSASGGSAFSDAGFDGIVVNLDSLTYAGNPESLADVDAAFGSGCTDASRRRYFFEKADICDRAAVEEILKKYDVDTIVHFAAESHVDRSISGPEAFIRTNVTGTFTLLDAARNFWKKDGAQTAAGDKISSGPFRDGVLFHHISTDEVYGSLGETGYFTETTPYDPRSPYSASKASSDHLVMAYFHTYGLPVTLSNCTNNYGPYQFPEKLLPLMILNMTEGKALPVYGDGKNIRDWIYVEDHNRAVFSIMKDGRIGEKYNIGGENEWENIRLLDKLIDLTAQELGPESGKTAAGIRETVTYVKDRPGHDRRYAIDCTKIKTELGWQRKMTFEEGLTATVRWYLGHPEWIDRIRSGEYLKWIERNYGSR